MILNSTAPLVIVRAPAGSGKTVLLTHWAHEAIEYGRNVTWVALEADTANRAEFWFEVAIRICGPSYSGAERNDDDDSPPDASSSILEINQYLETSSVQHNLVIDAYRHVSDRRIDRDLVELVATNNNLRLLVATRVRTSFEDLSLLANIDTEIVPTDLLLFDQDDTIQMIEKINGKGSSQGIRIDTPTLPIIARLTGFAINRGHWPLDGSGDGRISVADAILERHLHDVSCKEFMTFLLNISVAEQLTSALSYKLSETKRSEEFLYLAEELGLGIWQQQGSTEVFSITPLLREALYRQLEHRAPGHLIELKRIVAHWGFENQAYLEALRNAVEIGDYELATEGIRKSWNSLAYANAEKTATICEAIEPRNLNKFPLLAMLVGVALCNSEQDRRALQYFRAVIRATSKRSSDADIIDQIWKLCMETVSLRKIGKFTSAGNTAAKAVALINNLTISNRLKIRIALPTMLDECGISLQYASRTLEAISAIELGIEISKNEKGREWYRGMSLAAGFLALKGDIPRAKEYISEIDISDTPEDTRRSKFGLFSAVAKTIIELESGRTVNAQEYLRETFYMAGSREHWPILAYCQSSIYLFSNQPSRALSTILSSLARNSILPAPPILMDTLFRIQFFSLVALGHHNDSIQTLNNFTPGGDSRITLTAYHWMMQSRPSECLKVLGGHINSPIFTNDLRTYALARLIFGISEIRLGRTEIGTSSVRESYALMREFSLKTPKILVPKSETSGFIQYLLDEEDVNLNDASDDDIHLDFPKSNNFVKLTKRELCVLEELAKTSVTREIATTLFVSVNTVKTQLRSLYKKLDAKSRAEALIRASELGLLSPKSEIRDEHIA